MRGGTTRDSVLYSVGANAAHGLRRTNEDKRRAAMTLLNDAEWAAWSDREIARQCVVDGKTVANLRETHLRNSADAPSPTRTVERAGRA